MVIKVTQAVPCGYTTFCDDIRTEQNGKKILVGVYSGSIEFYGEPPGRMNKLCLSITYFEAKDEIGPPVEFQVFMPGDEDDKPSASVNIPVDIMKHPLEPPPGIDISPDSRIQAQFLIDVEPCIIKQQGRITVRALRDGHRYLLGSIMVIFNPAPTSSERQMLA